VSKPSFSIRVTNIDVALCLASSRLDANRFRTYIANTFAVLKQKLAQEDLPTRDLQPRAETITPLSNPAGGSAQEYGDWFKSVSENADENGGKLPLYPSDVQIETWKVEYNGEEIPIGATGLWRPFGDRVRNYEMHGLTGCTAIVVIVSINKTSKRETIADTLLVV
jgi:hypothetical protein